MDRWCRDFDNWAICDTMCFNLFDRTPHAWAKVTQWSSKRNKFEKRTAFALLWSLSRHDKRADDKQCVQGLVLIERAAADERNFVKKGVNMALRAIGKRNRALNAAAVAVARRLADSQGAAARWVWKGRAPGAHESRGDQAPQGMTSRRSRVSTRSREAPPAPTARRRGDVGALDYIAAGSGSRVQFGTAPVNTQQ